MSFTVAMMYDFIHSLKVTASFLQNNNQYHKEVCPCSPYRSFSTLNYWCYLSSLSLECLLEWSTSEELTDLTCMHYSWAKFFGALFHWKWKTIVKRPLTCWWLCQDLDKVTSDWLQRKSPLTKTIGVHHCHGDLSDLNSLNIGWRATPDSECPRKYPM